MTRFALLLVAMFPSVALCADEPKPITTELEGVWQEPGLPGDNPTLRWKITFMGDKVTMTIGDQIVSGTVWTDRGKSSAITIVVTGVEGKGILTKGIYTGAYRREDDGLTLLFDPYPTKFEDVPGPAGADPKPNGNSLSERELTALLLSKNVRIIPSGDGHLGLVPVPINLVTLKKVKK